ncbi:MAG: glycosyltransferase [Alphaproteobacteria bacterium]|nr:glycosyltransferase [Alphaproteobacteria bacterium]
MKISLVVLVLNEVNGLRQIMPTIGRDWVNQILIVDGGSTDGSIEWCEANGYQVMRQKRRGIRHGYIEAMEHITGDAMITFSPDGNSLVESIPAMAAKLREGWDMVIASRYLPPAKSQDDDLVTGFGNWLFTGTVNRLHGGNYTDAMVILRGYRKQIFFDLDLHREESYVPYERICFTTMGIEPLLSVRAAKRKLKVTELAFDEPPRVGGGTRKLQVIRWGAAYYLQFIRELWCWK